MTEWQIRVTGGFVYVFPFVLACAVWSHQPYLAAFAGGASAISAKDAVGFFHPAMWQDLTAGKPVTREYWESGSFTSRADTPSTVATGESSTDDDIETEGAAAVE